MTDTLTLLVYTPFALFSIILLGATLNRNKKTRFVRQFIAFFAVLLCWQVCEILIFSLEDPLAIRYLFDLKLIFVACLAVIVLMVMISFFRLERFLPSWFTIAICVVPATTAALSVTTLWHPLLLKEFTVLSASPTLVYEYTRGTWFYVHQVYCQILVLLTAALLLRFRQLPKEYRSGSVMMAVGVAIYAVSTLLETAQLHSFPIDMNLVGASISGVFIYLATIAGGRTDYLRIERRELFNYLEDAVFVLNADQVVVDVNAAAHRWLDSLGMKQEFITMSELLGILRGADKITIKQAEKGGGDDLYFINTSFPLIYNMTSQEIRARDGTLLGSFVLLRDVTHNRLFIERLREMAGVDGLTGLPNRHGYQEILRELDTREHLPLTVIVGDVNGLKEVNDTYGHHRGDLLLKSVAEVLAEHAMPNGRAARVGGDEFVMVLPGCTQERASEIMDAIRSCELNIPAMGNRAFIALGAATKHLAEENLNSLVAEADSRMYKNKR